MATAVIDIPASAGRVLREAAAHIRAQAAGKPDSTPPPGSMVVRSGEVEDVARGLIERYPDTFGHLLGWSVVYAEDAKPPSKGCAAVSRAVIVPPVYQQLYGDDLLILVASDWWETHTDRQREGALFHAMSHVWTATEPETGDVIGLRTSRHQVEAFFDEIAHMGDWRSEIREATNQLRMFDDSVAR